MDLANVEPGQLSTWLTEQGWLASDITVKTVEPAGAGNMNITRRVRLSDGSSVIVKQAVPFVAKYPDIPAPIERGDVEADFYRATAETAVTQFQPKLIGHDHDEHMLVIQDLGDAADFTDVYSTATLDRAACDALEQYLDLLHGLPARELHFRNLSMRALNHEHIFALPFGTESPVDLDAITPGLADVRVSMAGNRHVCTAAHALGEIYLGNQTGGTPALLHGDFFPGSWLRSTEPVVRVIDPEFAFFGPREFDLGVFIAHRLFGGESPSASESLLGGRDVDADLARAFAGTEVIRRLLGVAQLPLDRTLDEKRELVDIGNTWLRAWNA